eukprot:356499-Chlamydomonas_euryale.AAC.1
MPGMQALKNIEQACTASKILRDERPPGVFICGFLGEREEIPLALLPPPSTSLPRVSRSARASRAAPPTSKTSQSGFRSRNVSEAQLKGRLGEAELGGRLSLEEGLAQRKP